MTDETTNGAATNGAASRPGESGPIQVLAIAFEEDAEYRGLILEELTRLQGHGLIRVLDLLFVGEDASTGDLIAFDYQGDALGGLVGALLGFAFADAPVERVVVQGPPGPMALGLTRNHLEQLILAKPPDYALGVVLIEHVWARGFKRAMQETRAQPIAEAFLSPDALREITEDLEETIRILSKDADGSGALVQADEAAQQRNHEHPEMHPTDKMARRRPFRADPPDQ